MRRTIIPLLMLWSAFTISSQNVVPQGQPFYENSSQSDHTPAPKSSQDSGIKSYATPSAYELGTDYEEDHPYPYDYDRYSLRKGWNIDLQVGVGAFIGSPIGCGTFVSKTRPVSRVHLGKWFTPTVGSRLSWEGASIKASDMAIQKYQAFHMDLLWNLAPMISENANFTLAPYVGTGCVWNQTIGHAPMALSYGVTSSVKISEHLSAVMELGTLSTFKYFDGITSNDTKPCFAYRNPRLGDNILNFTVGLSYTIPSSKKSSPRGSSIAEREVKIYDELTSMRVEENTEGLVKDASQEIASISAGNEEDNSSLTDNIQDEDREDESTTYRLYTTEELLALTDQSNEIKRLAEQEKNEKELKEGLSENLEGSTVSYISENTDIPGKEDQNAFEILSKLMNEHFFCDPEEVECTDSLVSSNAEVKHFNDTIEVEATGDVQTENHSPISETEDEPTSTVEESKTDFLPEPLSPTEEDQLSEASHAIEIIPIEEDNSMCSDTVESEEDKEGQNSPYDCETSESEEIPSNTTILNEHDSSKEESCNLECTVGCRCVADTTYLKRILLSYSIGDELDNIFSQLHHLNQDDPFSSESSSENITTGDPCLDENLRLRMLLDGYIDLTERLMDIVRLGKEAPEQNPYLWIDECSHPDEDHDITSTEEIECEGINYEITEDVIVNCSSENEEVRSNDIPENFTSEARSAAKGMEETIESQPLEVPVTNILRENGDEDPLLTGIEDSDSDPSITQDDIDSEGSTKEEVPEEMPIQQTHFYIIDFKDKRSNPLIR